MDSLKLVLATAKEDTNKVNTLYELSGWMMKQNITDFEQVLQIANDALRLSEKIKYKKGIAGAQGTIGNVYLARGSYVEAIKKHMLALQLRQEINDKAGIAKSYYNIGHAYGYQDNYPSAINYFFLALKTAEEIKDSSFIQTIFIQLGAHYGYQEDYLNEKKYFEIALRHTDKTSTDLEIAEIKVVLANVYLKLGNHEKAHEQASEALMIYLGYKDYFLTGGALQMLAKAKEQRGDWNLSSGNAAGAQRDYSASLFNFTKAEKYYELVKDSNYRYLGTMSDFYADFGVFYIKTRNLLKAEKYLDKSITLSKRLGWFDNLKISYHGLYRLDSAKGDYKRAFENYKSYILYRDTLVNKKNLAKAEGISLQYDFDKKEDSLNQKHIITETKLQVQKKQKYFYWAGLFMLGLLSVFVFLNFRNQKKINKLAGETHARQKTEMELQSQQAILNERLRISSELHDEVGATLSGIAMYSHLTKEQMKTGQMAEIEKSLNVMQQSSTQMVDKLNDIVWLINPEQDSLQKLIERLEEYATDMAAIKNMKVKITVPDKIAEINLPIDSRRNIYLFCKEAINNSVKYSNGSLLELTVKEIDNKLEFSVSDNGRGFDAVMVRRGNGLENMQKRADEIGAKLILQSKLNEGALVSMQCKIT